ncbi:MAG TPA: methyltransferase domain-containing protein [Candidatus Paceibacterota bacterium]
MTKDLIAKYPWLKITTTLEKYIEPDYYDQILKRYIFDGKSDLAFLEEFINSQNFSHVLEIGPGTGRGTHVLMDSNKPISQFTLVDQSERMLEFCKERFAEKSFIRYVRSDALDFLLSDSESYDFVFSLWSFSHSIHQNLKKFGVTAGEEKIRNGISKLLTERMRLGGSFFFMHFDSLSDEQRISIKQRRRDDPVFQRSDLQSPSKLLLDKIFSELVSSGTMEFKCEHYIGKPLEFASPEDALEYYLNFHMESHFNNINQIENIITELLHDIESYRESDGVIRIKPGCFVYTVFKM